MIQPDIIDNFASMNKYNKNFALPNEVWSPVKGYEGLYAVSSMGRVKNLITGKILKPVKSKGGYLVVNLWKNGKCKKYLVHRLVAQAFLKPVAGKDFVNHLSEVKTSNHYSNLEWCTPKENLNYGTRNERAGKTLTNRKDQSKPVQGIDPKTGKVVVEFPSTKEAGRNGFDQGHVSNCCLGKYKQAYGYIWRYK